MKIALVGESIQYSLSPLVYERLLKKKNPALDVKLLDFKLPQFEHFMHSKAYRNFDAVCFTQPYKALVPGYFSSEEQGLVTTLGVANFLIHTSDGIRLFNTDLPALHQAYPWSLVSSSDSLLVVGNGAMARVLALALEQQFEPRLVYCVGRNFTQSAKVVEFANKNTHHTWRSIEGEKLKALSHMYVLHATSIAFEPKVWGLEASQFEGVFDLNYRFQLSVSDPKYWDGLPLLIYQALYNIELLQGAPFEILPLEVEHMLRDRSWSLLSQENPTVPPSKELS